MYMCMCLYSYQFLSKLPSRLSGDLGSSLVGELTSLSIPDSKEALESSFRREEWLDQIIKKQNIIFIPTQFKGQWLWPSGGCVGTVSTPNSIIL